MILRPAGVVELGIAAALLTKCMIRTGHRALTAALFVTAGLLTLTFDHLINIVFARG